MVQEAILHIFGTLSWEFWCVYTLYQDVDPIMWVKQCHFYHPWLGMVYTTGIKMMILGMVYGNHGVVFPHQVASFHTSSYILHFPRAPWLGKKHKNPHHIAFPITHGPDKPIEEWTVFLEIWVYINIIYPLVIKHGWLEKTLIINGSFNREITDSYGPFCIGMSDYRRVLHPETKISPVGRCSETS